MFLGFMVMNLGLFIMVMIFIVMKCDGEFWKFYELYFLIGNVFSKGLVVIFFG